MPGSAEGSSRGRCLDVNVRAQYVIYVLPQLRKSLMFDRTCAKVVQGQTILHVYLMIEWLQWLQLLASRSLPSGCLRDANLAIVTLYDAQAVYSYVF